MFPITPHLARLGPADPGDLVTVMALDDDTALIITADGRYKFAPHSQLRVVSTVLLPGPAPDDVEHEHELGEPTVKVEGSRVVGTVRRCEVEGCDYTTLAPVGGISRA